MGYAVKTLESKETKASKEITVTHNSVFAAHRLQCRMTLARSSSGIFVVSFCHSEPATSLRTKVQFPPNEQTSPPVFCPLQRRADLPTFEYLHDYQSLMGLWLPAGLRRRHLASHACVET